MKKASKMTFLALSITLALILSFVESQIPAFVAIPGVKVGLPNIVIVFLLYKVGAKEAGIVSALRVVMVGFLFGSMMSMLYSLAGAVLSFCGMALLKRPIGFPPWQSVLPAAFFTTSVRSRLPVWSPKQRS